MSFQELLNTSRFNTGQTKRKRNVVKDKSLCDTLSVRIVKCKRLHQFKQNGKDYAYDKSYYMFQDLTTHGLTLAQLYEIHMRLGQFLAGEKQP